MALVNQDGTVVNVIVYDPHLPPEKQYKCPSGCQPIPTNDAPVSPGDIWDGEKFIPAPRPEPEEPDTPEPSSEQSLLDRIAALEARLAQIEGE